MHAYKPAPTKMMLAIDKSRGRSSVPAPAAGAVPKPSYKPAISKRPAPAVTTGAKMPVSNQMRGPQPVPPAAKPPMPKTTLKPAQMTQPPMQPKPAVPPAGARSMPPHKKVNNDESSPSMAATSLGTMNTTSKLRIVSIGDVAGDASADHFLVELSGIIDSIDRDDLSALSWKIVISDTSANTIEVEYWPSGDETKERIGIGSTYRFIGRVVRAAGGQPKITALAIKESGGEDEVVMNAMQKAAETKKNEA